MTIHVIHFEYVILSKKAFQTKGNRPHGNKSHDVMGLERLGMEQGVCGVMIGWVDSPVSHDGWTVPYSMMLCNYKHNEMHVHMDPFILCFIL